MKLLALLVFQLVIIISFGFAQEPVYIHYTTEDGLPSSEVHAVIQDSNGFMWFGTDNGICRFDGYEFKTFTLEDGLLDKVVFGIFEDSLGRIWVSQSNNKICYFENNRFTPYKYNDRIPNTPLEGTNDFIEKIIYNKEKKEVTLKWNRLGISIINKEGEYTYIKPDTSSYIIPIDVYPEKRMANISMKLNTDTFKIRYKNNYFSIPSYATGFYRSKFISDDSVFFSVSKTAFITSSNNFLEFRFSGSVFSFYADINGYWFGLSNGKGARFINKNAQEKQYFLEGFSVTKIYLDKENNYWFTTLEDGVFCMPNLAIKSYSNTKTGIADYCKFLEKDDRGRIYITRERDLYVLLPNKTIQKLNEKEFAYILKMEIQEGNLWVSTNLAQHIYLIDNKIELQSLYENPFALKSILKVKDGLYITASSHGLRYYYDFSFDRYSKHYPKHFSKSIFKHKAVGILKTSPNKYLVVTYKGLFGVHLDSVDLEKFSIIEYGKMNPLLGIRFDQIIYNQQDSCYWLASKDKGIVIWNPRNKEVKNISKSNGLTDNAISCIYADSNNIYAGTKKGLNEITLKNDSQVKIRQITIKNGLPSNEINDVTVINKMVYVATLRGLCYFNSEENHENNKPPPVHISNFIINEKDTLLKEKYALGYKQNNINIHFVGLAYKAQKDIQYKFRLLGSDTTWKYTKNLELRFPDLSSGKYSFEVMAQNEDGYWSKEPARVSFTIKPPYWETWWFRSMIVLLVLLIFGLSFQYRMRELKKRNLIRIEEERKRRTIEKNLTQTKQKLVTQQLNPHFLFNTMSSIQYMIINNQKMEAVGLLSKFARMMRQGLEYSRVEYALLDQSIEFFKNYIDLKSIVLEEKIEVVMETSKINSAKDCSIPPMLIQPFIENAIIHGLAPKKKQMLLKLSFFEIGKNIKCTIEDNGIGRKQSAKLKQRQEESYESFGVKIINETLEMMNTLHGENYQVNYTDLINENNEACGTRVEIGFPKFKN